ncbi:hypothetical protein HY030_01590 [Candidatus Gottesmanbacteria bacterium]|nr:hypothetical protein [Candidatus Gottesmanbacteria bacterium]
MQKKVVDQITITVVFLFFLSLLRFKIDLSLIPLWLGGLLGAVILETDYLFQVFLVQPELPVAQDVRKIMREFGVIKGIKTVFERTGEIKNLTFHTIFFQVIFYVFALFITTSSGSVFGQALVLTALLSLLTKQVKEVREIGELDKGWFYRLNVSLTSDRQKIYVAVMVIFFILLTTFALK